MQADNTSGLAGRGLLDIVDAQVHLSLALGAVELTAAADALGIRSVVLDEIWGRNALGQGTPCVELPGGRYRPLSPLAQAATLQQPYRFSFLQRVTRHDPDLPALVPLLAASPGCRSLRIVVGDRQERDAFAQGHYDLLLGLAQTHGLAVSLLSKNVGAVLGGVAPRFPDLRFVIDHCGWSQTPEAWDEVLQLASQPNTVLKWSHAGRAFGQGDQPAEATQRAFLQALDRFGAERVLWASDITHEETNASWAELLGFVRDNPALSLGDKQWVLGKTARQVYQWPTEQSRAMPAA